jgi:hypothetical protein
MIKLEKNHGFSYSDWMGYESELDKRSWDNKSFDCYLGNLKIGTLLETKDNKWIATWGNRKYQNTNTALTYLVKLLNG